MKENYNHQTEESKGLVEAFVDDKKYGEITYSLAKPATLIIDHTQVEDVARGTGVGKRIVEYVIAFADENGFKIIPICPFAKVQFEKNKQWSYILK